MTEKGQYNNSMLSKDWLPDRVAVLGAGRSGVAAAKFLSKKDISVFISETCSVEKLEFILASNTIADIPHEADGHTQKILECDLIICSPGIPSDISILKKAKELRIPVWSEVELGYRQSKAQFLAVTGSTGKSTTVGILGSILSAAEKENVVAGNIGLPIISIAREMTADGFIAAEISSFQLENIDLFRPRVAAVLNLMKNHLDRYDSEEDYYNTKKSIVQNMSTADRLVLNAHDVRLVTWAENLNKDIKIAFFGDDIENSDCVWCSDSNIHSRFNGKKESVVDVGSLKINGNHNVDNACAAAAMACAVGIDKNAIAVGIGAFEGLPHRLEFIREINGVKYYNDSKATTAESVECAVNSFHANVHLIAGGKDKGCDFSAIRDSIKRNAQSVCLIGEAAGRISKEWKGLTEIKKVESLEIALKTIKEIAGNGDVVILSPGCSSFDMFSSFEERGEVFKKLVHDLT